MRKSSLLLLCASMFLAGKGLAQTKIKPCATDEMRQLHILQHPEILQYEAALENEIQARLKHIDLSQFSRTTTSDMSGNPDFWYDIPVVVHIIHDYNTNVAPWSVGDYLSDDNIFDYVTEWNKVYSAQNSADTALVIAPFKKYTGNAHIRLHLATIDPQGRPTKGITRHRSYLTYNGGDQAKYDDWDPSSYINIWSINTMSVANGEAAAYATPPSSGAAAPYRDGVIGLFDYMNDANHPVSRTINHEIGHVLNLAHTWGNNNSAAAPGVNCAGGGTDGVDDTPPTLGHNVTGCTTAALYDTVCATNYFKIYTRPSTGVNDSLVNYPDTVNSQNIMDYTYCSRHFTKGQVERMHAALNSSIGRRNNLWDPINLVRTGVWKDTTTKAFVPRPDLPPIPEFSVTYNAATSSYRFANQQYFAKPGSPLIFKNRTWNDTVTSLTWTFGNSSTGATVTQTNPNYTSTFNISHAFSTPGWASLTMAATGNHTGTVTKTWEKAIFVAESTAVSGIGYFQEFNPAGDVDKWPTFNIYNNEFKWEPANVGFADGYSLKYTGFDSRLDFFSGSYPTVGSPFGDFDDFFSVPVDLSSFGTGVCNLNFFTSGASRSSNSLDISDTFQISYSTDGINWITLATIGKGDIVNKGVVNTPYTPSSSADWVPRTIKLPTGAKASYVLFRFRYRPGVDHLYSDYSTSNNFYIDRIHFSAYPASVSSEIAGNSSIVVAPNPTSGNAYVIIKDADNSTANVVVSDITGKVVYTTTQQVSGSEASIEIPASVITVKGVYLVQTSTGKQTLTQKLVVY